jgi:hypothetical protein
MPLRRSPAPECPTEARPDAAPQDATVHRARRRVRSLLVLASTLAFAGGIAIALALVTAGGWPDGSAAPT